MMAVRSLLTEKQKKVLKLRDEGYTQKEIAEMLGTSRANISTIEKRARLNLDRARATLREYGILTAPLKVRVERGVDLLDIPKLVFKEADRNKIKVKPNSLELIARINAEKKDKIENRVITGDFEVYVGSDGEVTFD